MPELLEDAKGDLATVCRGLSKLVVVDIALSRDQDNPQLIFESMNSTGKELSQADLIRNYVLMGQPPDLQERLYTLHWRPMELAFGQEAYSGSEFSAFMRDFLTLKTAEVPRLDLVYEVFKQYERQPSVATAGIEALLADLHATAIRYCCVALGKEPDTALQQAFHDLRELKVGTKVLAEGPYGIFTAASRHGESVTAFAAGVGVTPVRAMLEDVPEGTNVTVVYRVSERAHAPLHEELEDLVIARGWKMHYLQGPRHNHPLTADYLSALIPGFAESDVYVCGPDTFTDSIVAAAEDAGVPQQKIHHEAFAF